MVTLWPSELGVTRKPIPLLDKPLDVAEMQLSPINASSLQVPLKALSIYKWKKAFRPLFNIKLKYQLLTLKHY